MNTPNKLSAIAGLSAPSVGAAATISGEGVSPAASAAARGSPPGKAAATSKADAGLCSGFFSRHLLMTFSINGSRSFTSDVGVVGVLSLHRSLINSLRDGASKARFPVNNS